MNKQKLRNLLIASLFLTISTSCGSGINSDAKKAADLACKAQKMAMEMDVNNTEKLMELQQEATALYEEMAGKYQSTEDMQEFAQAYQEELSRCE